MNARTTGTNKTALTMFASLKPEISHQCAFNSGTLMCCGIGLHVCDFLVPFKQIGHTRQTARNSGSHTTRASPLLPHESGIKLNKLGTFTDMTKIQMIQSQ
jgi:hypothetical protein